MRIATTAALALSMAALATAAGPKGPAPRITIAKAKESGEAVNIVVTSTVMVAETRTRVVVRDGRKSEVKYTVYRPVMRETTMKIDGKSHRAVGGDGKPLTNDVLLERLEEPAAVAIVSGSKLDPGYLKLFDKNAVIILSSAGPVRTVPAAPRAVPAPAKPRL